MCGIVYSKSFTGKPVNIKVFQKYKAQRGRGYDGFGFYLPESNQLNHNTNESRILSRLRRMKASEILFHHRLPTSTANVHNSCHPFSTKDTFEHNYVGVHNGVIWNDTELKKEQAKRGIKYVSEDKSGAFNDSEALIYDLALYLEGKKDYISAEGSMAFIMIQRNKKGKAIAVYFGRNTGNPLIMNHNKKELSLSSEGKGTLIQPDKMYCFNYKTGNITTSPCHFPSGYRASTGYSTSNGYTGMGFGYAYSDDDDEIAEVMDRAERERYFAAQGITPAKTYTGSEFESSRINIEITRLLADSGGDPYVAVEQGAWELKQLKKQEDKLKEKVEVSQNASDKETDDYYEVTDLVYYLELALEQLQKEVAGVVQQGFFRIPEASPRTAHYPYH